MSRETDLGYSADMEELMYELQSHRLKAADNRKQALAKLPDLRLAPKSDKNLFYLNGAGNRVEYGSCPISLC